MMDPWGCFFSHFPHGNMFSKHAKASSLVWLTFDTTGRLASSSSPPSGPVQSPSVKGSRVGWGEQTSAPKQETPQSRWAQDSEESNLIVSKAAQKMTWRSDFLVWIPEWINALHAHYTFCPYVLGDYAVVRKGGRGLAKGCQAQPVSESNSLSTYRLAVRFSLGCLCAISAVF